MTADPSEVRTGEQPSAVGASNLMPILYSFPVSLTVAQGFSEIATGVAHASNQDPLLPSSVDGARVTSCFLLAIAWRQSRFLKTIARGRNMGLYQLRIPEGTVVRSTLLMLTAPSSLVAIDRVRESLRGSEKGPLPARLAPFYAEAFGEDAKGRPSARALRASAETMVLAARLVERFFPAVRTPRGLLLGEGA